MQATKRTFRRATLMAAAFAVTVGVAARADEHRFTATDPVWQEECGSCHIAYPPALLPVESWRAIMAQLDRHFGVDAGVDAPTAKTITAFLEANAGRDRRRSGAGLLRITETRWFVHEHDEVPARAWKSPAVKSAANCEACHTRAAQGDFSEHTVKVPR
jgi:hypothetical protein